MVTIKQFIDHHLNYNAWANIEYISWLGMMDETILTKEAGNKSILIVIQHLTLAQEFWNSFLSGESITNFRWERQLGPVPDELKAWKQANENFYEQGVRYTDEELFEVLSFNSHWAKNSLPCFYYIMHCINHATHHRGQISAIARFLSYEGSIPHTEYSIYLGKVMC